MVGSQLDLCLVWINPNPVRSIPAGIASRDSQVHPIFPPHLDYYADEVQAEHVLFAYLDVDLRGLLPFAEPLHRASSLVDNVDVVYTHLSLHFNIGEHDKPVPGSNVI